MKTLQRGFTLIELLVVIAIIGILSSIVLASLSSARTKGEDAAIQSTLSNMRAQAELYYSNNSNYGSPQSTCAGPFFATAGTGTLKSLIDSISAKTAVTCGNVASSSWAVAAALKSGASGAGFFCVDSTGAAKATSSGTVTGATCGF